MKEKRQMKRALLYSSVASVGLAALSGIVIVLRGHWGWFEFRVIATTITIATASLLGLACDLSRTPRGRNWLPRTGMVLTSISAMLIVMGIWETSWSMVYWKSTFILSVFAIATVHASLISIAQLARRFRWISWLTKQLIFGLALLISVAILFEIDDEPMIRFIATLAMIDAALNLIIPLLHRISKTDQRGESISTAIEARNAAAIDDEIEQLRQRIATLEQLKLKIQS